MMSWSISNRLSEKIRCKRCRETCLLFQMYCLTVT